MPRLDVTTHDKFGTGKALADFKCEDASSLIERIRTTPKENRHEIPPELVAKLTMHIFHCKSCGEALAKALDE